MRQKFIETLVDLARQDERVYCLAIDVGYSVLEPFQKEFPNRFLNTGIAEANAVGVAAGLALSGKIVYVYSIIPFVTMRPFEQVRNDLAYMNTNVRLVGVGAGLTYGPSGATHHAIEDLAVMRALPNMLVFAPGDPWEVEQGMRYSLNHRGPMYIRLGKKGEPTLTAPSARFEIGKVNLLAEGQDICLIATSNAVELACKTANILAKVGTKATVASMHTIKPLDSDFIQSMIAKQIPIVTLEEHSLIGGLGSAVAEVIAESGVGMKFKRFALPDQFCRIIGSQDYIRKECGLDAELIAKEIQAWL